MEERQIVIDKKTIEYILVRKPVKNINLRCKSDLTISVSANAMVPTRVIDKFVAKKSSWIIKNLQKYEQVSKIANSSKEYVSGEEFKYLGNQLRLKVIEDKSERVVLNANSLELYVKDKNNFTRKKNLIENFYREETKFIFNNCVKNVCEYINKPMPILKIQHMVSRWGSCIIDKNTIVLNASLIYAPQYCIEYVVLHEMIHFEIPNHNNHFYTRLTVYCPDWKECKKLLDKIVVKEV